MVHAPGSDAVARCRLAMCAWSDAHGIEPLSIQTISKRITPELGRAGVSWRVTIGKATIDPNQGAPGVLDDWTWSGRVDFWRRMFGRFDGGRQGRILARREDGLASITSISRNPFDQLRAEQERGHGQAPPS